jgi:hypothetical protein
MVADWSVKPVTESDPDAIGMAHGGLPPVGKST